MITQKYEKIVSSPMRTTSQVLANSSAVCTIKTSASSLAFIVVQPFSQSLVLNKLRKDRLLSVLDRNTSFFVLHCMFSLKVTFGEVTTLVPLICVMSFVEGLSG